MQEPDGFTLVEVLVAMTLMAVVGLSVSAAVSAGRAIAVHDRAQAIGRVAAQARLASLGSLAFHTIAAADGSPIAVTDTTTDVTADPPGPGGTGLAESPADALWTDRAGYVDYLDTNGRCLGAGVGARNRAAYVRRWAIGRQGVGAGELASMTVLVAPIAATARVAADDLARLGAQAGVVVRRGARMRQAS
jgi:prepilin-type N-terminal cleavage/methylation domain-containing protein